MDLDIKTVLKLLEVIAEGKSDAVAENVIVVLRGLPDDNAKALVAQAVADGLGVSLV